MKERDVLKQVPRPSRILVNVIVPLLLSIVIIVAAVLASNTDLVRVIELHFYDLRMVTRKTDARHYPDRRIAIIALDEESLRSIEEPSILWIPRFTVILSKLKEAKARTIGFDMLFLRTPDEFISSGMDRVFSRIEGPRRKKEEARALIGTYYPRFDNEFGNMLRITDTAIAAWVEESSREYLFSNREIMAFAGEENIASAIVAKDPDGAIRQVPTICTDKKGRTFPSLSLMLASRFLGKQSALQDGSFLREVQMTGHYSMLINYTGPADTRKGSFRRFSFKEIDERARRDDRQFFADNFKDSLVLFGPTDLASQDLKKTPYNSSMEIFPGVEVHANAINTILHHDYIKRLAQPLSVLILALLTITWFFLGFYLPLSRSLIFSSAIAAAYCAVSFAVFHRYNIWIDLALPALCLPAVLLIAYGYRYVIVEKEKIWIRKILSRYVSQPVAEALMKNPDMLRLGGEYREISILFSDINHFTTISETRKPEEIMEVLNDYFTLMEEIIFRHRGTLKQFVGDEIMVIFGAPEKQDDHRLRAVRTAVEMREALDRWRQQRGDQGKIHFDIKMSVHSGTVTIGNVGSPHRTEYAAVGDCVNTGSRIMGLNKVLNTSTLISEEIYQDVKNYVIVEDKGIHQVKGKGKDVHIYSLLGLRDTKL